MSTWPTTPSWRDPTKINSGKAYVEADGVTAEDFNIIIEDLMYLLSTDRVIPVSKLPEENISTAILYRYGDSYYKYVTNVGWVRYLAPFGTKTITRNGYYPITEYASIHVNVPTGTEDSPLPVEIDTEADMTAILTQATASDVGAIYKYVGPTTSTYENGTLYIIAEV